MLSGAVSAGSENTTTTVLRPFFATPPRLTSAHLHHPLFFTGQMPFLPPTNSVKALKATEN